MDVRELPRILFREFTLATLEATEDRWVGETTEGAGLVLRLRDGSYGNAILELRWRPDRLDDQAALLLEIEAGLRESGDLVGSVERLDEGTWIRYWTSPILAAYDLGNPRNALMNRLAVRANELVRSGGFELASVLYDRQRRQRLEPPLPTG